MFYLRACFMVLTGTFVGVAMGYLMAIQSPQYFRSVARFRIVAAPVKLSAPTSLINGLTNIDDSVGIPTSGDRIRKPVYLEGDKLRRPEVIRLAVEKHQLDRNSTVGTGGVDSTVEKLAASTDLNVSVVGLSDRAAIFEIRYDSIDPKVSLLIVDSLLNAYKEIYFPDQSPATEKALAAEMPRAKELLEQLDTAENELDKHMDTWSKFLGNSYSVESFRERIEILRAQIDAAKSKRDSLVARYDLARQLTMSKKGPSEVLSALRGEPVSNVDAVAIDSVLKAEIKENRESIVEIDRKILDLSNSSNQQMTDLRDFLSSKTSLEQSQREVEVLRNQYEEVSGKLNKMQDRVETSGELRFELVQAANLGDPDRTGVPLEIVWGGLYGGIAGVLLTATNWAATAALRERRRRAW